LLFDNGFRFRLLKKEENIGSEVVNVVKPYTAAISDAFKVPETPVLDDEGMQKKQLNILFSLFLLLLLLRLQKEKRGRQNKTRAYL
jgi:hypothetical protein